MLIIRISCLCICYASSCSNVCNKDISVCVASAFQFVLINEVSVKILFQDVLIFVERISSSLHVCSDNIVVYGCNLFLIVLMVEVI